MTTDLATSAPTAPAEGADGRRGSLPPWPAATLAALVVIGAIARAHGFSSLDLWFDDAWAAAPARVGLSQAVHMVLTAPGYGLALRSWVRLDPATTWFAQIPAFVLGLCAIPAVYALLRYFGSSRWISLAGSAAVAVSPVAVQYSTRLKEYPFDLLSACALLWLEERARRTGDPRSLAALAAASVAAFFVSAGTAPVIAGAWIALVAALVADRRARASLLGSLAATLLGCLVVWGLFLRHLPHVLTVNWRRRGFLVDYGSHGAFERSVTLVFGGFVHAALAYPVPATFFQTTPGLHAPGAAVAGLAVLGIAIGYPIATALRRRTAVPALAAAASLLVAVLLAFADRVPLGDGRTDEVLYPALAVCLAAVAAAAAAGIRSDRRPPRAVRVAVSAALIGAVVAFGASHRAVYPTVSLRGVAQRLAPLERPGDVVFVDTFNSFGWCYYELAPCRTQVGGRPVWPQGFRPVATTASVFIAAHYRVPLPEFTAAQARAVRIWYVGFTYGTFDVGADPARYNLPVSTWFTGLLSADGWHRVLAGPTTQVLGVHAYAILYVRSR